ncbi:hypothetical protein [Cognaticolwellia beringensis]|uniref:Lipoprotein n=1 Tax=Cognaticolwellia beringensis TaxID=1967665 RepID=A0A222G5K9_9GAMM|nr:hypothetical protein [Cognaticolwellia beringensis]ASP47185.1 hypothetical protein B5D82_05050 [Cognaticolwellia beringensis]
MNITEKLTQPMLLILLLPLLAIILVACSPQDTNTNIAGDITPRTAQCIAQQSQCQFDIAGGQVHVLFDVEKIVAEQSFNMVLNYQGNETLKNISGYLEGVDMFMGKIPLFIEPQISERLIDDSAKADLKASANDISQSQLDITQGITQGVKQDVNHVVNHLVSQVFQAEVLVGSCSVEHMTWRIWLTFTTNKNKTFTKMFTVPSYRI